jgi:hypothetical protein
MGFNTVAYATVAAGTVQYTAGDVVGGTTTFSALNWTNNSGELCAVTVTTLSGGSVPLTLAFFNAAPTTVADNAPGTFAAADLTAKLVGIVAVGTADYALMGTGATPPCSATIKTLEIPYKLSSGGNLYCVPIVRGTPTFTAANHLILALGVKQD